MPIRAWLEKDEQATDLYELTGTLRFDVDRDEILTVIRSAYGQLLPYQNHSDSKIARRAINLQMELARAEAMLSDPEKLSEHWQGILDRLRSAYNRAKGGDEDWNIQRLRSWLTEEQSVHPEQVEKVSYALLLPEGSTIEPPNNNIVETELPVSKEEWWQLKTSKSGDPGGIIEKRERVFVPSANWQMDSGPIHGEPVKPVGTQPEHIDTLLTSPVVGNLPRRTTADKGKNVDRYIKYFAVIMFLAAFGGAGLGITYLCKTSVSMNGESEAHVDGTSTSQSDKMPPGRPGSAQGRTEMDLGNAGTVSGKKKDPSDPIEKDPPRRNKALATPVTPAIAKRDLDKVLGKEVVWTGWLQDLIHRFGETHILVGIRGQRRLFFEAYTTDPRFSDNITDYVVGGMSPFRGDQVKVTGTIVNPDEAAYRLHNGLPMLRIKQIARSGDPDSVVKVGKTRSPDTLRQATDRSDVAGLLRHWPMIGTKVKFRGYFVRPVINRYQRYSSVHVCSIPHDHGDKVIVKFPNVSEVDFIDYQKHNVVEVTAVFTDHLHKPELLGISIVRTANPLSLITNLGRETPALDFTKEEELWKTIRFRRDASDERKLRGAGLYNGYTEEGNYCKIAIKKLFFGHRDLNLICGIDGDSKAFLDDLREGEEVLFEFSSMLAKERDLASLLMATSQWNVARVLWMSRIGEPNKKVGFLFASLDSSPSKGVARKQAPSSSTRPKRVVKDDVSSLLDDCPAVGTEVKFHGCYKGFSLAAEEVRVSSGKNKLSYGAYKRRLSRNRSKWKSADSQDTVSVTFVGATEEFFADYRLDDKVQVTAVVVERSPSPVLLGKSIVRSANPLSLVTDQGREKPALDFSQDEKLWRSIHAGSKTNRKKILRGVGIFRGYKDEKKACTITIDNLYFSNAAEISLTCRLDARSKRLLDELLEGEEVLFGFSRVSKWDIFVKSRVFWMSRISEPSKRIRFKAPPVEPRSTKNKRLPRSRIKGRRR